MSTRRQRLVDILSSPWLDVKSSKGPRTLFRVTARHGDQCAWVQRRCILKEAPCEWESAHGRILILRLVDEDDVVDTLVGWGFSNGRAVDFVYRNARIGCVLKELPHNGRGTEVLYYADGVGPDSMELIRFAEGVRGSDGELFERGKRTCVMLKRAENTLVASLRLMGALCER